MNRTFNGKILTDEQSAINALIEAVEQIEQSMGSALPDPIEGPQGGQGPQGERGPEGPKGSGIIGLYNQVPGFSVGHDGDWCLVKQNDMLGYDVKLYRKMNGKWFDQNVSLKGPTGPVGPQGGTEIEPNPVGSPTDTLNTVEIDGTIFDITTALNSICVHRMVAPSSTTLTADERDQILGGIFIEGDFLGYKNPIMLPATQSGSYYYGTFIGPYNGTSYTIIGQYQINPDNSIVERGVYGNIELRCLAVLNGKAFPQYPNSSGDGNKYDLIYAGDGELYWHRHGNVDSLQIGSELEVYAADSTTVEVDGPGGASDLNFNNFNTINLLTQGSGQVNIGVQDEGGDLYVYGDGEVAGDFNVDASLRVGNDVTVDNDINCSGDVACDTIHCDNQAQFNNDIEVNDDCHVHGNGNYYDASNNLTIKVDPQNGEVYAYTGFEQYDSTAQTYKKVNDLSQIVDSNGNRRFRELTLTMNSISGVHWGYCAAVINGCELNIIISGTVDAGTTLSITDWGSVILPAWIYQQLQPIIPNSTYLSVNNFSGYYSDWNSVYMEIAPYKAGGNELAFYFIQTPTFSQDAAFRYQVTFTLGM